MSNRRTSSDPTDRRSYLRGARLGACLLVAGWAVSATAAPSDYSSSCDDAKAVDLQSLDVVLDALSAEVVDLMANREQTPDTQNELKNSKVPYLYLTPRVATILENVFGDDAPAVVTKGTDPAQAANAEEASTSPVADNVETPFAGPESPHADHDGVLPRFQRQMYRTDI